MYNPISKILTTAYKNKTLPEGWYYFSCAGTLPQIGKYTLPSAVSISAAKQNGLEPPQPMIYACPGLFIGTLETIRIIAPIPSCEEALALETKHV